MKPRRMPSPYLTKMQIKQNNSPQNSNKKENVKYIQPLYDFQSNIQKLILNLANENRIAIRNQRNNLYLKSSESTYNERPTRTKHVDISNDDLVHFETPHSDMEDKTIEPKTMFNMKLETTISSDENQDNCISLTA